MSQEKNIQPLNKQQQRDYDSNINPFESNSQQQQQQKVTKPENKKTKKVKKSKKQKKHKKQKKTSKSKSKSKGFKQEQNQQIDYDEEESQKNSMFDDEAESGQQDYQDENEQAQIGFQEERAHFQELYKRPNATQRLLQKFQGKNQREINAQYSKKAYAIRHQQQQHPSQKDPKIYIVHVRPKSQDDLAIRILNKARHFSEKGQKTSIVSVISLKKRFMGKIFIQAYSIRDITSFLDGFTDVYLGKKIEELPNQQYMSLFNRPIEQQIQFKENTFVRIKKGLYEGDLAKVFKVKKSTVDVIIVPRINVQQIQKKINAATQSIKDQGLLQQKKEQLLKLLIDHKQKSYKQRPARRQLFEQDFFALKDMPGVKNIRISNINGLIILNYLPTQLSKVHGTYLPVEMIPFTSEGKFIQQMKQDIENFATSINFKKGEQVQIISGAMQKHYGTLVQIKNKNVGVIKCRNKQMKGVMLEEPLQNLSKKFKQGQRVMVTSGLDNGKVGIIIKMEPKFVQIWTDNSNSLRVSKRNLQISLSKTITSQNVHNLKKDDLIKTNNNHVGVVVQTTKDNIKILNTDNVIQIVSNLDFDQKIIINNLVAKNKNGDQIKSGSIVTIRSGMNQGKRCRVVHVYRQQVFVFNQSVNRNGGIICESAENCALLAKSGQGKTLTSTSITTDNKQFNCGDNISIGQTITLKTGALKGYSGIVKTITSDRIEVRILSKAITQWVPLKNLISKQQNIGEEVGKTPNRMQTSFRGFNDPQSPANYH